MQKRVILHIGLPKTGSSALQALFAEAAPALRAKGIAYPYPDAASVIAAGGCTGNAIQILYQSGFADPGHSADERRQRVTAAYFTTLRDIIDAQPEDTVLISGEYLSGLDLPQVQMLRDALAGHVVDVVCLVRDPFDHAHSCWRQLAKSTPLQESFAEYLSNPNQRFQLRDGFSTYAATFERLHVLRYERHRADLSTGFFAAIGRLDALPDASGVARRMHNASLSHSEAELCVALRKGKASANFAIFAARQLLERPNRRDLPFYDPALHAQILRLMQDAIDEINRRLPAEDRLSTDLREDAASNEAILPEDCTFLFSLMHRYLLSGDYAPSTDRHNKALPPDFSGAAYLILNPDVAAAGLDPAEHFLRHGRDEKRLYSFH